MPRHGGLIGRYESEFLGGLLTRPGAGVVLAGVALAGGLLVLDMSLHSVVGPVFRQLRAAGGVLFARPADASAPRQGAGAGRHGLEPGARQGVRNGASPRSSAIPSPIPSAGPVSSTIAAGGAPSPEQIAAAAATLVPPGGESG
ncbi:MAG: hypothetical protein ACXWMX_04705, partial [Candidatus Limnocylindrales bacterium]